MSSTVLMKCDWPIMMLASAGISIRTVRNSSMLSLLFPGFSSCAFPVLRPNPFNVPSSPEVDTHSLARSNEQRNLYDQAIFERGFLAARVLLRTRGRCGADHASLNSVGQNNTDWLSLEKLSGNFDPRLQKFFSQTKAGRRKLNLLERVQPQKSAGGSIAVKKLHFASLKFQVFQPLLGAKVLVPDATASHITEPGPHCASHFGCASPGFNFDDSVDLLINPKRHPFSQFGCRNHRFLPRFFGLSPARFPILQEQGNICWIESIPRNCRRAPIGKILHLQGCLPEIWR